MKNAICGFVLCLVLVLVMGADMVRESGGRLMPNDRQLVTDHEGRYLVVNLYSGEAEYVVNKKGTPSDSQAVKGILPPITVQWQGQ